MTTGPYRERRPSPEALAAMRAAFDAFGGEWTSPPVMQPLTALLDLAGEALRARLFVVAGELGEEWALRPDFTIALARLHISAGQDQARRLYEGDAFRNPPRGSTPRPSEFVQIGVETFGEPGDAPLQDAQIAALAWRSASAGGRDDLRLILGDVGLFAAFLTGVGMSDAIASRLARTFASGRSMESELTRLTVGDAPPAASGRLSRLLSELPETEAAAVLEELWGLAGIQPVGGRDAREIVHRLVVRAEAARAPRLTRAEADLVRELLALQGPPSRTLEACARLARSAGGAVDGVVAPWARRVDALTALGADLARTSLAVGFVRPFGYYDGMLFEVRSAALHADEPVAAGGRSDGLIARLGGAQQTSVGCMVRPARAWVGA